MLGLDPDRQIDLLVAVAHLSDRCDAQTLHYLLTVASVCSTLHPAIVHSKSRLVQRILTCDVSRLRDPLVIAHHLLNPLVLGLALPELSPAHFDDVMSSSRILLDIIEQLRYEFDDSRMKAENGGSRRLCNRRVSMSSNHLPRLLITAARPSIGGDGRKMSFLSADGRLEDRGSRRESKDSRCSLESEMSLRICNGSDVSDESAAMGSSGGGVGGTASAGGGRQTKFRRKSWLEQGYLHSMSLEQPPQSVTPQVPSPLPPPYAKTHGSGGAERCSSAAAVGGTAQQQQHMAQAPSSNPMEQQRPFSTLSSCKMPLSAAGGPCGIAAGGAMRRSRSPEGTAATAANLLDEAGGRKPSRPNSFTNLGHNLACTLWKTFY
uniref:Rho-GAP domain-containing protein n=2 Tax=Globodera pallida TaxID=36090 RepID=A0A183CNQ1_GLOPA